MPWAIGRLRLAWIRPPAACSLRSGWRVPVVLAAPRLGDGAITATQADETEEASTRTGFARLDPRRWRGADIRVFSSASDAARARRPTDGLLVILSALGLALLAFVAPGPTGFDTSAASFVDALPGLFGWFWELSYDFLFGWAVFVLVAAVVSRGRKRLLVDEVLAGALAFLGAFLVSVAAGGSFSDVVDAFGSSNPPPIYPAVRFAVTVAVVIAASPHLSRPLRYLGRWVLAAGFLAAIALGVTTALGALAGLALATGAAAFIHLVFGSPGGRLDPDQVGAALHDLGVETSELADARLQARGAQLTSAVTTDGRRLAVKVYGRDAWDGQFLASIWGALWYRDEMPSVGHSRLQQVEHEAFVTLLAERAGVQVLPVIAAGMATGRDALLVIEVNGDLLVDREPDSVDDGVVRSAWAMLGKLHATGVAHGQLDAFRVAVLPDGTAALLDFAGARVAAPDSFVLADRAQLLVTTALVVGNDRAVAVAADALGAEGLAAVLPFLQAPALSRTTRRAIRERKFDLDPLRDLAAKAAGVEVPKLEQIKRVTVGSVLMVAVVVLLAYAIISAVAGVGLDNLIDQLKSASGPWLWIALVMSPIVLLPEAVGTMGATERPVRYPPLVALQSAIQFIQLAVPSSAARVALEVRFFQRAGATTTGALAVGLIDGVSGFCVQVFLLLSISLTGLGSLNLKGDGSDQSFDWTILVIAGIVVVIAAGIALAIPRVRTMLKSRVADSRVALRVFRMPSKVAMIFFGNLTAQLLQALILGLCLRAFGQHVPFADLILTNTAVSLFAGFMPVPGGIGVAEAGYTACLAALGVPQTVALATALTFRLVTYYLPPIWGGFAMKWLRSHQYV